MSDDTTTATLTATSAPVSQPPRKSVTPETLDKPSVEKLTVEEWQERKKTHDEEHRPAIACNQWPVGKVLSEDEYVAGIKAAMNTTLGSYPIRLK